MKFWNTALVVVLAVCFCTNTVVEIVVKSLTEQFHPVVAAGKVTVHPGAVGVVPTLMLKDAVPLFTEMLAAAPPHPPAAIVGAVLEIRRFPLELE